MTAGPGHDSRDDILHRSDEDDSVQIENAQDAA